MDGVAFHDTDWHNNFGAPMSHGCINMSPGAAKWLYRWTTPPAPYDQYFYADDRGTCVIIQ
jgi:lipoprotein-anchoring transpeptidase ErfK/SrfK